MTGVAPWQARQVGVEAMFFSLSHQAALFLCCDCRASRSVETATPSALATSLCDLSPVPGDELRRHVELIRPELARTANVDAAPFCRLHPRRCPFADQFAL